MNWMVWESGQPRSFQLCSSFSLSKVFGGHEWISVSSHLWVSSVGDFRMH